MNPIDSTVGGRTSAEDPAVRSQMHGSSTALADAPIPPQQATAGEMPEDLNAYRISQQRIERAARYLPRLQPGLIEFFKLETKMRRATDAVIEKQEELNRCIGSAGRMMENIAGPEEPAERPSPVDLRTAAYVLALDRVAQTAMERGIWP
ncbi:MAG: hypothetical protein HUU20_07170 [Pirellulales bacterium]|nr:hypothetical protein [Pirellulales bacterium]